MATATRRKRYVGTYKAWQWQIPPWRDKSHTILLTGSAGGGKSRLAGEKCVGICFKYPGAMGVMLRKTRNSMTNSTVLFVERTILAGHPQAKHFPSKRRFEFANGSILAYGGMANEEQREQIRSIGQEGGLDFAWLEEATGFNEDDYNEVLARMRGTAVPWNQTILSTNPAHPHHWINRRMLKGGEATTYFSSAKDNPANPPSYFESLDRLTGVTRKRLRDGLWVQAEGAIYDEFSHGHHIRVVRPADIAYYTVGVDEGYTNPAVALVIGHDNDGRAHIVEEFYQRRVTQETLVKVLVDLDERFDVYAFHVDSAAAGLIASMAAAGLPAFPAKKAVNDGIQLIKAMLAIQDDGRPRLTVDPLCVNTISEFESYVWAEDRNGNATDKPVKENDHSLDALRYNSMATQQAISPGLTWIG